MKSYKKIYKLFAILFIISALFLMQNCSPPDEEEPIVIDTRPDPDGNLAISNGSGEVLYLYVGDEELPRKEIWENVEDFYVRIGGGTYVLRVYKKSAVSDPRNPPSNYYDRLTEHFEEGDSKGRVTWVIK